MRAFELTDRIKAAETLEKAVHGWLLRVLAPKLEALRKTLSAARLSDVKYRAAISLECCKKAKVERSYVSRARWAAELGFANPSRLSRACLLAHGRSIDELECAMVFAIVQKFLNEIEKESRQTAAGGRQETEGRQDAVGRKQEAGKEAPMCSVAAEKIIKEAVSDVMRLRRKPAAMAMA